MNKVLIVVKETYLRQITSLSFWLMVLTPFLFLFLTAGVGWVSAQVQKEGVKPIALITQDSRLKEAIEGQKGFTTDYDKEEEAKKAVKKDKLSAYILVQAPEGQVQAVYHGKEVMEMEAEKQINLLLQNYQAQLNQEQASLSPEQKFILSRQPSFKEELDKKAVGKKIGQMISFYVLVMFMYFILITYASSIAQEVANEKGTKIMEIIFSSIPAHLYFLGRILGFLAIIMTHIAIYVVGGIASYQLSTKFEMTKEFIKNNQKLIDGVVGSMSVTVLLFIVLGIFIYVVLAALLGSLVSRAEDANKAVSPIMFLIMIAFFGAFTFGQSGDHILMRIGSYIPFLSTFFMPIRSIMGKAGSFEVWLSLGILFVTVLSLVFYIGKSYAGLVLQTDDLGLWKSFKKGIASR